MKIEKKGDITLYFEVISLFICTYRALDFKTSYPNLSIEFAISSNETTSSSKANLTLLELNEIFALSLSTPSRFFNAPSIFCNT